MLSDTAMVRENMVWNLAGQRLDTAGRRVHRASLLPGFLLNHVGRWLLGRMVQRLTDDAIWFRGVRQEVYNLSATDADFDADGFAAGVQPKLESLKANLRSIREQVLSHPLDASVSPNFRNAHSALLASLSDLFEAVEDFRWALLEAQANRAPRLENMHASTKDDLDAVFARLEQLH